MFGYVSVESEIAKKSAISFRIRRLAFTRQRLKNLMNYKHVALGLVWFRRW